MKYVYLVKKLIYAYISHKYVEFLPLEFYNRDCGWVYLSYT